ncbi:hypothetical protein RK791_04155 [Streptococcus pneumoniae]|nr:hypothetical protein [Streptococcus pneumoniae]MDS4507882.1 hypothetical protein [Streptococcus pneumoniae]MDS8169102.1 hypothetical protein [Streptococcus pneumoniae]
MNEEIRVLQENLDYYLYEFEKRAIRLEIFGSTLNMEKMFS